MTEKNHYEEEWLVEQQQDREEHDQHHPTAAAMANHIVANLGILWTKLHQYHWYVKGPQFFSLHQRFEALYNDAAQWYDEIAEVLLGMGARPFSTTERNLQYTFLSEQAAGKYQSAAEMVEAIAADFHSTRDVVIRAIQLTQEQKQPALEDVLIDYKKYLDKQIWMLQAFLGNTALEGEE